MKLKKLSPALLALIVMACLPAIGSANLVLISVSNNTLDYQAVLQWTAPSALDIMSDIGGVTPWDVSVLATGAGGGFQVTSAHHEVAPHPGLGEGVPGPALSVALTGVTPGGSAFGSDIKLHGTRDSDTLRVSVVRVSNGVSDIYIYADHVPEPASASVWVFALGSLVFAARRRLQRGSAS